jgi:hypothetical protein
LSGESAVSYVADYVDRKKPKVRYCIYGLGATTAVEFCTRIEPDRLDRFQTAFDAIVDTFQEKTQ